MVTGQEGEFPSYCYADRACTPRLNSALKISAAWMWLPAIAMVTSLGVSLPSPARAQTVIGNQSSTVDLSSAYPGLNNFQTYGGTTISGGANAGIYGDNSQTSWTITNAGSVSGNPGIHLETSGTLTNTGAITSAGATGVYLNAGGVVNNGDINHTGASITGYTYGVQIAGAAGTVFNFGTITANSPVTNYGPGIELKAGGAVTNYASGTISGVTNGIYATGAPVTVTNYGLIQSTSTATSGFPPTGVALGAGGSVINQAGATITGYDYGVEVGGGGTIVNRGTISSTASNNNVFAFPAGVGLEGGGVITNSGTASLITGYGGILALGGATVVTNHGTIQATGAQGVGVVFFDFPNTFSNTLVNYGTIIGQSGTAVRFGNGDDRLEIGTGASFNGDIVDGGGGNNTLEFLAGSSGTTSGYSNFQNITLDTGASWTFTNIATIASGGTLINAGTLSGDGSFGSYGFHGAALLSGSGTLSNSGTIISLLGFGVYGDNTAAGTLTNTGTITGHYYGVFLTNGGLVTNGDTLHTAALIAGYGGVYITGGGGTVVNYGSITGTGGAGVLLEEGGSVINGDTLHTAALITGQNQGVYAEFGAGTVTNYGTIAGAGGYGVELSSGGYVYNRGTASLIYGGVTGVTIANAGSIINYGTIIGGSGAAIEIGYGTISNYGTVNGSAGVIFDTGRSNTLTNQGVITGTTGAGVASGGTLAVINGGTNDGLATIGGATYGVSITGYGGVTNFGTITGTSYDGIHIGGSGYVFNRGTASLIQGGRMGVYIFGTGTVTNQGTIAGGTTSYGVYIRGGSGTVTNSAGASISGGWGGIHIEGGSSTSTVINYGTIASTSQSGTSGIGVVFADNFDDTLINGGTIIGTDGTAVQFGNGDDLLELLPGASFTGVVEGGSGNNTLAFGGSSPGYFSGLGSGSFVNFGTYAVYSGANWTFTGANTLDSGITLTNEGTVTTTGTFTNQGVINSVYGVFFNNGALINNNSITGLVRLGTGGSVANYGAMSSVYGGVDGANVVNSGSISNFLYHGYHAIYLLGSGSVTNSGTASLITGRFTIRANGALTLTNQGTITGSKDGVILAGGGSINNSGYIGATTYSSTAIDIIGSGNTTITNSGRINGGLYGIDIAGSGGATITNMGAGLISGGKGIYSNAGGSVAVTNYGTISGAGAGIVFVGTSNATVINSGTIIGTYGPGIEFAGRGNDTLVNSGAIIGNGGTAVQFGGGNNLLEIEAGASFGGAVEGGSGGVNTLEFLSGTIATTGFYNFQIIDVANGAGGAMNGYTTAQYITNHGSLVNGANLTISNTGTYSNGGTFTNASDGYFLNTGTASISIINSSLLQNDGILNNQGTISVCNCSVFTNSGTLINSGTIAGDGSIGVVTLTGSGLIDNSGLIIANSGATAGVYVESGTITNRSGGTISDYYGIRIAPGGNATVTNAGTIAGSSRFYYGAGILLGSAATLNLTNQSGGVISGYYGIGIGTGGHATITNAGTITSTGGGNYGAGIAVRGGALNLTNRSGGVISGYDGIFVGRGSSATIVNAGSITGGNGAGIDGFGGTVMVTNQSGGVISGYSGISFKSGSVTVLNSGVIGGTGSYGTGIAAGRGLTVTNYAGGVIYGAVGIQGGTGSVITNMGTIASNGLGNPAILLSQGGTVFNSGTASVIVGGILIGNPTLANGGSVDNEGFIIGYEGVAIETGASDFVTNSGTIAGLATGVYLGSGGAVTNIGKSSYISSIGPGVLIGGGTGIVTNAGTIAGEFGVVFLDNGGTFNNTVVNSGTIIGNSGTSVQFGNGNNRLVVEAGYKFQGLVEGGSGANTFEVGSGSANFAAVGSEFIGFDDIQIDPGASLNLGTNPTIPAGFTIANTGSLSNSGTLTIDGVLNNAGGTFANTGVVIGATTGLAGGGDIINSGTIIGGNGAGVDFTGPGSLNNTGLIIGSPFGLVAGAGDTIVNSGTIKDPGTAAVALGSGASLTNAAGQLISGVTGVQFTGTGASLTNLGTITGTGGIAIQFGAGSNTATLGTGSVLNGGIDGGGGAGQIVLAGTGTFSSVTNPLTNFGTGSVLTVASGANWGATGNLAIATVSNAGTLKPGSLTAPLKVSGNFAQTSSGTLQVALDASGAGSQLQVTGAASLAGSVAEIQSGTFTGPVKFTILTATGGVSGTFSSISGGTALLTPSLSYDANDVYVTIAQLSVAQKLATIGGTANEIAAATAFDAGRTANPASFLPALSGLDQLNSAGLTAALDKLDGENNADLSTAALIAGRQFVGLLQQHDLGSRGSDAKWTVWGSGFSQNGSLAGNGNAHQMAEVVAGGAAGVDYRASEALRIGAALGYGSGHFSVGGGNGTASIDYTEVALTGDYSQDAFYVNGVVGGTFGTGDSLRNVSLPGLSANAAGHPRNSQALGALEAGYTVGEIETVSLTPFASMDVGSVDQHAFTETGAGTLNLGVAAKTLTAAQSVLGTRASADLTLGDLVLNTDFKLGWAHEFSTARRVTQSFAGSPSFTVAGASLPGDSAVVGVGVATTLDDGLSAYVHYDGAFAGGDSSSTFSAGIRFGW